MITVKEALDHILDSVVPLGLEKTDILSAWGRVIEEDIHAPRDIPPKDNSAMDGYAVRSEETIGAGAESPVTLTVTEDIPAGYEPRKTVGPGEAARIMTGAPIPERADAVVKVEETACDDAGVRIYAAARHGENVRYAGEDVAVGDLVIRAGTILR
ncbi:MAG: molybdopterin molybdenumtransferase MoeA, partial [Deltaproteobacteria bacterium]|nr:molybdopterin molybdenumtransferase MoeA [Deltaproteobacteria bacterium]